MARLFISHATADRKFVERELLGLLRALGFDPWFAESDIRTSEQWERMILGALRSSKWFVLVMSPKSAVSEWVKDELAWAIEEAPDYIVPILIEDCNPRDFTYVSRGFSTRTSARTPKRLASNLFGC